METLKLNVLLSKTDSMATQFKAMIKDYGKFFATKQGAFVGVKQTYEPRDGTIDEPKRRGVQLIQTTVKEKFDWLTETSKEYIDSLFSQEKTNASGAARAILKVNGSEWGEFTSLELLRLKNILENGDFYTMLQTIPVYSDSRQWEKNASDLFKDRVVMQSPLTEGVNKSTEKEDYILPDPNLDKLKSGESYQPVTATRTTIVELGDYTVQEFTGEISQRERAAILSRRNALLTSVIEALKVCNECEAVISELTSKKVFGYIFDGMNNDSEKQSVTKN